MSLTEKTEFHFFSFPFFRLLPATTVVKFSKCFGAIRIRVQDTNVWILCTTARTLWVTLSLLQDENALLCGEVHGHLCLINSPNKMKNLYSNRVDLFKIKTSWKRDTFNEILSAQWHDNRMWRFFGSRVDFSGKDRKRTRHLRLLFSLPMFLPRSSFSANLRESARRLSQCVSGLYLLTT